MKIKKKDMPLKVAGQVADEDIEQETQTPSHGYNADDLEGGRAADNEDTNGNGSIAEPESILLQRLRQIMEPNGLSPYQKMILAVIASSTNSDNISELTYDEIGARASLSSRNVATHIPILEKEGWIKRIHNSKSYKYLYLK